MKIKLLYDYFKNKFKHKVFFLIIFFLWFVIDVFFIKPEDSYTDWGSDVRLFALLFLWLFIWKVYRFSSRATLKLTLVFIIIFSVNFILFKDSTHVERLASLIYVYLTVGVVQQLLDSNS